MTPAVTRSIDQTRPVPSADRRALEAYAQTLVSAGLDPARLVADADGTVTCAGPESGPPLAPSLPCLSGEAGRADEVQIQTLLGEGGMGQVFAAQQVSLQREVAVKRLRPGATDRDALLREALVTGRLEHPGIVPVHLLGQTQDGAPLFVMKRIEGTTWRDALKDPAVVARLGGGTDTAALLDFHLDVLARVSSAVAFAHARGVLHRDLKPDNVMLGAFGEVYVVDWGLAVATRPDAVLPEAAAQRTVVGTPAYMAPEMALGHGAALSERSDVFLLGAILYELLAGRAPYRGASLLATLTEAHACTPAPLPATTDAALAALCRRAMARSPDDRPRSAEAFREALVDARRHAGARALSRAADERCVRLEALAAEDAEGGIAGPAAERLHGARALYAECRFGYQQALAAWPEGEELREGMRRAVDAMLGLELAAGNVDAAALLLLDAPGAPDPARVARVEALRAAREQEIRHTEALRQLARDHDLGAEAAWRARMAQAVAVLWSALALVVGWADRTGRFVVTPAAAMGFSALYGLTMLGVQRAMARRAGANGLVRRMVHAIGVGNLAMVAHWGLVWAVGMPFRAGLALFLLWVGAAWMLVAVLVDRQILPTGLFFAAAGAATLAWPGLGIECFAAGVLLGMLHLFRVWRRLSLEPAG